MKAFKFQFRRSVKVLQIFRNVVSYGKSNKSWQDRAEMMAWETMHSNSGFVKDGTLYLPDMAESTPDLALSDLITLEDDMPATADVPTRGRHALWNHPEKQPTRSFNLQHPRKMDFFDIAQEGDDLIFTLRPGYFEVGVPERDSFRVCVLRPGDSAEVIINGKTDFSMSSRRARNFLEQHYVFQYLGLFDSCYLMKSPYVSIEKNIPEERKMIDLKKPLW